MKQSLVDEFLAYYAALAGHGLSVGQRVTTALELMEFEVVGVSPSEPPAPTRWFEVTDYGLQSEEWLRGKLSTSSVMPYSPTDDLDTVMVNFAKVYGKVVTPLDPAVPPFYLINGERESIYQLRLRVKALYIDEWNTWSRDEVVARLRENGDTVQPL
jgi:hypothetical protein